MNETYWDTAESTVGEYVSYDDDYIFPVGDIEFDIWVSQYQIIYFFASLCFVVAGVLDLIIEKHCLHTVMILAGLFGVLSAVFVESNIHLSNVFGVVSVCLFFFEAGSVFRRRKQSMEEKAIRRALLFGDFCFVLATIFDIIVSPSFLPQFHLNTNLM
jgi:NADH:ubiquinone oxidoreductase subunit 6 (subunit J)